MTDNYQPWTWKVPECDENMKSKMIPRQDAHERVSGKAVYTRDIYLPGMLYAKILTSPYAHAKVISMDTSKAEAPIGVRDILKYDEPDVANENNTGTSPSNILALPGISIGTMNDFAPVHCILNESHLGYSAYGAYGIGENIGASLSGITSSAIYNAIGEWVLEYPTTPDKVLKALGKI